MNTIQNLKLAGAYIKYSHILKPSESTSLQGSLIIGKRKKVSTNKPENYLLFLPANSKQTLYISSMYVVNESTCKIEYNKQYYQYRLISENRVLITAITG